QRGPNRYNEDAPQDTGEEKLPTMMLKSRKKTERVFPGASSPSEKTLFLSFFVFSLFCVFVICLSLCCLVSVSSVPLWFVLLCFPRYPPRFLAASVSSRKCCSESRSFCWRAAVRPSWAR